ncbi:hypothetical protein BsWGS_25465 [Bradybaena similaris]
MGNMSWCLLSWTLLPLCVGIGLHVRQKRQILPDQPRIITENGHLIFQSGANHNITFRSGNGGVFLDHLDLKTAVNQALTNKDAIARLRDSLDSGNVTSRVSSLEHLLGGYSRLTHEVHNLTSPVTGVRTQVEETRNLLNSRLSHLEAQMTDIPGISDVHDQVSHLRDRVQTLEHLVHDANLVDNVDSEDGEGGGHGYRQLQRRVQALEDAFRSSQALLATNECLRNPCHNGATCVDMYNGYVCRCPPQWQGPDCSEDVDECDIYAGTDLGCQNGATCINSPGSFRCQCTTNWFGIHCREQHYNCTRASHTELCGHGTCVNEVNEHSNQAGQFSYRCICDPGWNRSSSDPACVVDIDECATGTHCSLNPPVPCINLPGSFVCGSCPSGYTGNGHTCYDINECAINNGGCSTFPRVECINTQGSRSCGRCPAGYQGNGVSCTYVGVCSVNNGGCHHLATCSETSELGVICSCRAGYAGTGVGARGCQELSHAGACASNPCANRAVCTPVGSTGFSCACRPGFSGPACSAVVVACLSSPCENGGTCVSQTQEPGYSCECTADFTGARCLEQQQDCGGHLSGERGTLRYPRANGATYPHEVGCEWVISTSTNKVLTVTFPMFALEAHPECNFDFLQIHDGATDSSRMIGKYCGTDSPNGGSINSTRNQLYFWFESDSSEANHGFEAHWTSHPQTCGGYLTGSDTGTISSPGYPGNYTHNQDCTWNVVVSPGSSIRFNIARLALEHHPDCSFDYLEIRDGETDQAPVIRSFCSSETPAPIQTTGPYAYVHFHSDDSLSDSGFLLTYAALTEGRQGCGGALSGPEGEVMSPGFPNPYQHNAQCVWVITAPPGSSVRLTFLEFDLETSIMSGSCWDYLAVRDGSDQMAAMLGTFCGTNLPTVNTSSSNVISLELHTDESVSGQGFKARWSTVCGGTFRGPQGQIQSPNWPGFYPSSKTCDYLIQVNASQTVSFQFTAVGLGDELDCTFNYIEFRDGANEAAAMLGSKLCSVAAPSRIMSTGAQMFVRFSTDGSTNNHGFHGTFTAVDTGPEGCGGVYNANIGVITSPDHPNEYPQGVNCSWYINVTPGLVIRLIFHTFSFQNPVYRAGCRNDYVEIYDSSTIVGGSLLGRYCGSVLPEMVTSSSNVLVVYMQATANLAREGFSASYVAINTSTICGSALTSASGVITSPSYPNPYPSNRRCEWTITAANSKQILVNITDLDIESHPDCHHDFLEIRNGGYATSPILQTFCGQLVTPQTFLSHSNKLYLKFESNYPISARGFRLEYTSATSGCGGDLTTPTGGIVSPNYPHPSTEPVTCYWSITVSYASAITLYFIDFDLANSPGCGEDSLWVTQDEDSDTSLGTFCGSIIPAPIRSESNHVWLEYTTFGLGSRRGFYLQYRTECNSRQTGYSGVIESPNFPNPYNPLTNCTWVIEVPVGNTINVSFAAFQLENHPNCQHDVLQIRDGGDSGARVLANLCGDHLPDPLQSTGHLMWLNFITDTYTAHDGFRLEWVINGCGGHLSGSTGTITSPNFPSPPSQANLECQWTITVNTGNSIELTVSNYDLQSVSECSDRYLKIFAGRDSNGLLLTQLCQRLSQPVILQTTGTTAFVQFKYQAHRSETGFNLTYRAVSGGCGGTFTADSAIITSYRYPLRYEYNTECEWNITVAQGHVVVLNFTDFFSHYLSCDNDYVKLYDGPDTRSAVIDNLCVTALSNYTVYRSSGNHMFVTMQSERHSYVGFSATYTTGCGGRLNADSDGEIFSPGYPGSYQWDTLCLWIISSSFHDRRVSLTFTHMDLPSSEGCMAANVTVFNGLEPSLIQFGMPQNLYCGTFIPATITSGSSALSVVFRSGHYLWSTSTYTLGSGFRAVYSSAYTACGGEFTAQSGRFMSPNFPDGYPVNIECVWQIKCSPGNRIQISFPRFQLDPLGNVNDDYVEIRSPDVSGTLVGRWIGNSAPENLTSLNGAWVKFRSNEDVTAPGFVAEYSISYGGNLVGRYGQIASPQYPAYYPGNCNYRWTVLVSQDMRIKVSFSVFSVQISSSGQCLNDYVAIYDGTPEDGVSLGTFCGSSLPGPLYSETNQITVSFISDTFSHDFGFLMSWLAVTSSATPLPAPSEAQTSDCWGDYVATSTPHNITSPGYPDIYPNGLDCFWTISVPVGYTVLVNITSISLESYSDCFPDYLRFHDGDNTEASVINTYCHWTHGMGTIQSTAKTLGIMFHTDLWDSGPGFVLTYEIGCGGFSQSAVGVIKSTNYPSKYPANQNCTWRVEVQPGKTINLDFEDQFNIADSGECDHDYLMLLNGFSIQSPPLFLNGSTNTNGRYCGSSKPQRMETSSNFLVANFVSDGSNEGTGFSLTYSSVSVACGGQLRLTEAVTSGYFMSPNYPENYPPNVDCIWQIRAPPSRRIQVDFEGTFSIETNNSLCHLDYIEFHDGGTLSAPRIGIPLCGTNLPGTVFSTGNFMLARFLTDSSVTHAGFKAKYSIATCGGRITSDNGKITSPNFPADYSNNLDCEWTIAGPVGHFLRIYITRMSLQYSTNCTAADILQIRDGNSTGTILFSNCGWLRDISVDTSDSVAHIRFRSDASVTQSGFSLIFRASAEECGGQLNTPTGVITSPNYPNQYPHRRVCTWDITVPMGRRVTLTFSDLRLEGASSEFCEWDYVEVINGDLPGSPSLAKFCGETTPAGPVESSGNTMKVIFFTDGDVSNAGFRATYTSDREAECGGYITESPGVIASPGYHNNTYNHNVQCVWHFNSHLVNSTIRFFFNDMNVEGYSSCINDFVEIREGMDINAPFAGTYCGLYSRYDHILIPGSHAWVRFKTDASVSYRGFQLAYDFKECGGILTDPQGVVASPSYPSNFDESVVGCIWKITTPEGSRVQVNFTDFFYDDSIYCGFNNLILMNGGQPDSAMLGSFCGQNRPSQILFQSNEIRVVLQSLQMTGNARFRMEYTSETEGCGGLFHSDRGSLKSPNYPSSYPHNTECRWDINVQRGHFVTLHFNPPFDLEAQDCAKDYVEVFDDISSGTLVSLGRWCSNVEPPDLRSSSTRLVVVFRSDATTNGNGFSASWDLACGGFIRNTHGFIVLSGQPNFSANNLACDYIISLGRRVYVSLVVFTLTFEDGHDCQHDYLRVWEGHASTGAAVSHGSMRNLTSLGTVCGNSGGYSFIARDQMTIQLRSDNSGQFKEFVAHYFLEECGGVFSSDHAIIRTTSRNWFSSSSQYFNNMDCSWNITVTPSKMIKLRFYSFDVVVSPQCQHDHVTVYDGPDTNSRIIGRYCGNMQSIPEVIQSTGNQMYITFITDAVDAASGFTGKYVATYGPDHGCGGVIRQPNGTISSVDVDGDGRYENNLECEWLIFVNENKRVVLTVTNLELEESYLHFCPDKLTIYDGLTKDSPVLEKLCGSSLRDFPVVASSNVALVVFFTDHMEGYGGFNLTFRETDAVCGGTYNATWTPEIITSPNYPNSTGTAVHCSWIIVSAYADWHLRVRVTDLQLRETERCASERLAIRNWPMYDRGQVYCGNNTPPVINSWETQLKITYNLATTTDSRGFQLTYEVEGCHENISLSSGRITSPRFPNPYPRNCDCRIQITAPENTSLAFYFQSFNLGVDRSCESVFLEVKNSSSATGVKFCGFSIPSPIFMTDNVATLWFKSDGGEGHTGYDITFISSTEGPGCGGNLSAAVRGVFTNPGSLSGPMTCYWYITFPSQHLLHWNLLGLRRLTEHDACDNDYVAVYEGLGDTGQLLARDCPPSASSTESEVPITVKYVSSGNSSASTFRFEFVLW